MTGKRGSLHTPANKIVSIVLRRTAGELRAVRATKPTKVPTARLPILRAVADIPPIDKFYAIHIKIYVFRLMWPVPAPV